MLKSRKRYTLVVKVLGWRGKVWNSKVESYKILGVMVKNDLKQNNHVDFIV